MPCPSVTTFVHYPTIVMDSNSFVTIAIGPVDLDGRYCWCWVRDRLPASIDDPIIQRELREVLFQEWLQKQLKETTLRLD